MTDTTTARGRIDEYLRQRELSSHIDPDDIHGVFFDPDAAMANLTVSDITELLAQLDDADAEITALHANARVSSANLDGSPIEIVNADAAVLGLTLNPGERIRFWTTDGTYLDVTQTDEGIRATAEALTDFHLAVLPQTSREARVEVSR